MNIQWEGVALKKTPNPVYLGVTLDRTLSFKEHVAKLRKKISSRNNLLGTLANSSWGADPNTLRSSAMALCYSTAEYCAEVWARSAHASKIDPELNKACRVVTGNLRATPLSSLYRLAGVAPPNIRRLAITKAERDRQLQDSRHPLHGHQEERRRLVSRKSFVTTDGLDGTTAPSFRIRTWRRHDNDNPNEALPDIRESLPAGTDLARRDWAALNRARAKVGKTGDNLVRWGLRDSADCPCGEPNQTMAHILQDCRLSSHCTDLDLKLANNTARQWISVWSDKI